MSILQSIVLSLWLVFRRFKEDYSDMDIYSSTHETTQKCLVSYLYAEYMHICHTNTKSAKMMK